MKYYNKVTEYFGKSLMLVNYLEIQSAFMEKKVLLIKKNSKEDDSYEDFALVLAKIRNNCEKVKEKLSRLAFQLSEGDEDITKLLDDVYLNQKRLEEIQTEMTNKNSVSGQTPQ